MLGASLELRLCHRLEDIIAVATRLTRGGHARG